MIYLKHFLLLEISLGRLFYDFYSLVYPFLKIHLHKSNKLFLLQVVLITMLQHSKKNPN